MLEKAKNFLFYGGADRESYRAIGGKLESGNRTSSIVFGSFAAVLIAFMLLQSFFQEGLSSSRPVYIAAVLFSFVIVGVALAAFRIPSLSYVSVYLAVSFFLAYGIAIALFTRPDEQTVTFMVLLIFVPLIFTDRPLRMGIVLALFVGIFIVLACQYKAPHLLSEDITDAGVFGLLSIMSQAVINRLKIRDYVLERRLKIMGETDQLTGLNNRNCYESRIVQYADAYERSIGCAYLDANGLHELNNNEGHLAGDKMLCRVADTLREEFGAADSYRIGGDEYVAFALDRPQAEIEETIAGIRASLADEGYHVSIGYEFAEAASEDVGASESAEADERLRGLISRAEASMYSDKAEYYRAHDRRRR